MTNPQSFVASLASQKIQALWRRQNLVLSHVGLGYLVAFSLGGVVLLLTIGVGSVSWLWLLLPTLLGIACGVRHFERSRLDQYRVAQAVDGRLGLYDALSTAWFLRHSERLDLPLAAEQLRQAERDAAKVEPSTLFPLDWKGPWQVAGAFALLAFVFVGVHWMRGGSADLHRPLLPVSFLRTPATHATEAKPLLKAGDDQHADGSSGTRTHTQTNPAASERTREEIAAALPKPPSASGIPGVSPAENGRDVKGENGKGDASGMRPPEAGNGRESGSSAHPSLDGSLQNASRDVGTPANASNRDSSNQNSPAANESLSSRVREALSGLMSKFQNRGVGGKEDTQSSRTAEQQSSKAERQGQSSQNGDSSASSQASASERTESGQSEHQTQAQSGAESASASQQSSGSGSNNKGTSSESGAGHQNGDKTISDAEQLKAMGKLAEIIGKRSENLTGDMTVERQSRKQVLETQNSGRVAAHFDSGRSIEHDHIPLELQDFVKRYMEQVHRDANH